MTDVRYDPVKVGTSFERVCSFVGRELEGKLTEVPGVSETAVTKLHTAGVTSTFQLLGKLMTFRGRDATTKTMCDDMYTWLGDIGINSVPLYNHQMPCRKTQRVFSGIVRRNRAVNRYSVFIFHVVLRKERSGTRSPHVATQAQEHGQCRGIHNCPKRQGRERRAINNGRQRGWGK